MTGKRQEKEKINHPTEELLSGRFETILCSLNEGVFCVSEDWRITCFNLSRGDDYGHAEGKGYWDARCHEVFRSNICRGSCALRYTMETGNPLVNLMITITDATGKKKPVSISAALLKDKQGKIVGGVETFRDLSLIEQLRKHSVCLQSASCNPSIRPRPTCAITRACSPGHVASSVPPRRFAGLAAEATAQALHVVLSGRAFWQTIKVAGGHGALPEGPVLADVSKIGCSEYSERRLVMNAREQTKERIMEAVWRTPDQRIRPIDLERKLEHEHGFALCAIKDVLKDLVAEGELVFTYRDPCSYVEVPVEESHHAARPMKVIPDKSGEYWICDDDADPSGDLAEEGCWRYGDLAFAPSD